MTWERILVRRVGNSFIGEARHHAIFVVGEMRETPSEALESASEAMEKRLAPMRRVEPLVSSPNEEDLL